MPGNTFGQYFRITTWGESHGPALGVVIDGCPPCLALDKTIIQETLDKRRPGKGGPAESPRKEPDLVEILSGVFEGQTTGTPILLIIRNRDARSQAYDQLRDVFRPGHGDYTYWKKYGIRDHKGGGRASGRETAARVAAAAVAQIFLDTVGIRVIAYTVAVGGLVEVLATGVPPGLGEPVFDKLDAELAKGLMSIGAVKGVEIGAGFRAAELLGSENNDPIVPGGFLSNNSGGILAGISNGDELIVRAAVKPIPSISKEQDTITVSEKPAKLMVGGRHDASAIPRIVPVCEAMVRLVLTDHILRARALTPGFLS
ncbi:MAG: chorismate synthase [Deltaproteobacteria bacterium]|nr:chorismate synthase [Deltaproteobacteria bacterium]